MERHSNISQYKNRLKKSNTNDAMESFSTKTWFIRSKTDECDLYFEKCFSDDVFDTFISIANNVNHINNDSKFNNCYCIDQIIALQK